MRKSDELKKVVDELTAEAKRLQKDGKIAEALDVADKLNAARAEYQLAKSIDDAEKLNFLDNLVPAAGAKLNDKKMQNRIFNKILLGRRLSEDEKAYNEATIGQQEGVAEKGGAMVPAEQIATLREYRRAYVQLKDYADVITAGSLTGKMPALADTTATLAAFAELSEVGQQDVTFNQVNYNIKDYGAIIPVSNSLLADADVDLISILGRQLARMSVNGENAAILAKMPAEKASLSDYKGLTKALNVDLDAAYAGNSKIFTNQDGLEWLAELDDANKRPLLVPDVTAPDSYLFRGHEIVVLPNSTLKTDAKAIPFYVGSMFDYVAYFERAGLELAVSDQAGFSKNMTLIRAIERFDAVIDDKAAMKAYTVTTA